jgi:hypothetical protein
MARALTNDELRIIDEEMKEQMEMKEKDISRHDIAEHLIDMRGYDPSKKVKLKGAHPEQLGIKGRERIDNQIHFR